MGTFPIMIGFSRATCATTHGARIARTTMNGLIYLVGLIVVIMAILSLFGLR
jgi:hypothetical protein